MTHRRRPASVELMLRNDSAPTPPLDDFRRALADDPNLWWRTACGHHRNLFEAACDRLDDPAEPLRRKGKLVDVVVPGQLGFEGMP